MKFDVFTINFFRQRNSHALSFRLLFTFQKYIGFTRKNVSQPSSLILETKYFFHLCPYFSLRIDEKVTVSGSTHVFFYVSLNVKHK